eukprot:1141443-Pelagomonas_calceolata.AAC.1
MVILAAFLKAYYSGAAKAGREIHRECYDQQKAMTRFVRNKKVVWAVMHSTTWSGRGKRPRLDPRNSVCTYCWAGTRIVISGKSSSRYSRQKVAARTVISAAHGM